MLKVDIQAEILSLYYSYKKSVRSIARQLGIDRKSVAAVVARRTVALAPKSGAKGSILDPFKEQLSELLKLDPFISGATLNSRIRAQGYMGGIRTVQTWLAEQAKQNKKHFKSKEAFFRLEFAAGECAQVDWGEFGDVFGDGIKVHCFVMVLAYSRLLYLEFTRSEKFEEFIRCHENAFQFFGGLVPRECWYDNLATAVTDRMGSLIRFNSKFMAYMAHHGIRPHACNPARGNEKGRVEDGVKYIRSSFWAGRKFKDFNMLCEQAILWRDGVANRREHRATHKVPVLLFEVEEKKALMSMNPYHFDTREVFTKVVPPNFHINYEANFYSVPWTLVSMAATVKVGPESIDIYYQEKKVAHHTRSYKRHQYFTTPEHSKGLLERKPGDGRCGWQIQAVQAIGPKMTQYLDLLKAGNRSLRNELGKILALSTVYGQEPVHSACTELLTAGIIGVDNLELFLKSKQIQTEQNQLQPAPLQFQNTKLNREIPAADLRRYDAILFESSHSGVACEGEDNDN